MPKPKAYTVHCPNCGLELGRITTTATPRVICTGCRTILYIGVSDRVDAAVTIQYPLPLADGREVELPA